MEHTSSKNFILWIVLFMVIIIAGIGFSYALFSYVRTSSTGYDIQSGDVKLGFFENNSGISLSNSMPIPDQEALNSDVEGSYFDFYVSYGIDNANLTYEIDIINNTENLSDVANGLYDSLDTSMVKLSLLNKDSGEYVVDKVYFSSLENRVASNGKDGYYLYSDTVNSNISSDNYRLYMWIPFVDSNGNDINPLMGGNNSSANKAFSVKLNIQAHANVE